MKSKELREKSKVDLGEMKKSLSRDLMDARFRQAMGQIKDKSLMRKLRRDIARVNTILREKQ
ncbi:MAG TPA: 50S ribosomal protein L29 [Deltaproteobacteria bacterium]|nr:50S ribosomal protein L29 [Desulfomonilia bacterium]HDP25684.1 50S ribosomal protein L29 [Deltaproteobacteria bacterium]